MTSSAAPQKQAELHSDLPIPPGEYLAEVLADYAMSQADLARRMDCPVQAIDEIVQGQRAITHEIALQLEQALRVPAVIWIGLETEYQLTKAGAGSA
jgi:HTH-type transcriptional regulator / antitoxin HigA